MVRFSFVSILLLNQILCLSQQSAGVWIADRGDGTYQNPVLYADYSDPDVCRAGDDFFMTASSFNCVPGLPILHSKDLVNWKLINHALPRQIPLDVFSNPQHGKGVWAPCIRFHENEFYIFYPDPDFGIYMTKAKDPAGTWSEPVLIKKGKGLIDPTPLWDDDGKAYLAFAFAGSRAGIKSILIVCSMNPEGTKAYDNDIMIFDGHDQHPTVEGPKFYKRNGYYYVFAPAGGVATGWQLVLRSKNILGPYESKTVMHQGKTKINGPHQGAWVDMPNGVDWFIHFQDKGPYGRVVHLQPMKWINDWPVIGIDEDGDGIGEPVLVYKKPVHDKNQAIITPPESDEFNTGSLGLQWQWHANPQITWAFPTGGLGFLRMFAVDKPKDAKSLWDVPSLLLQKFPAPEFTATSKITFVPRRDGDKIGLLVMGRDYAYISLERKGDKLWFVQAVCKDADKQGTEVRTEIKETNISTVYLRVQVDQDAKCQFSFSEDGKKFKNAGELFQAREGMWIGTKVGLFCLRDQLTNDSGSADVDWFRIEPNK